MQTSSSTTTFHVCASAYLFTGKERDAESGLDYFGARYYASTMGTWMSPDWAAKAQPVPYAKLDNPQSLNLYGYVYNNPLSRFNPDGHDNYTYDQSGKETSHADKHGFWWHTIHTDTFTLNADNGKSYSLDRALGQLSDGQRYTILSPEQSKNLINNWVGMELGD
jgi:RHS repeat-associated protein